MDTSLLGLPCTRFANRVAEVLVPQTVGPRILSFRLLDGESPLAELPDFKLDCPGTGEFSVWGGHRLWHAPEVPRRTYLPDDQPVAIEMQEHYLRIQQPVEPQTGLQKTLCLWFPDLERATLVVEHRLTNCGLWPVECAAWAITQLKTGGTAILPQPTLPADPAGVLPNRSLAIWPYTDLTTPHIRWGNQAILVQAALEEGSLKLGWPNPAGWLAYAWKDLLFIKQARFYASASYYDGNSSSQCYCNTRFIEMETLSPRQCIAPGATLSHREVWHLRKHSFGQVTEQLAQELAGYFDLGRWIWYLEDA